MPTLRAPGRRRRASAASETVVPVENPPMIGNLPIGTGVGQSETLSRPLSLPGVTIEGAFYAALVLVAVLLRFWRLADLPLSPNEARAAMASLEAGRGVPAPDEIGALLLFGNALVFAVAGATDATARFLPALVGALTPLALLPLRPLLGRGAAAVAAVVLTFSPLLIDRSRAVDSSAIGMAITLAFVAVVCDYARSRESRRLYAAAVLLALALTAGSIAFSGLVAVAIVGVFGLLSFGRRGQLPADADGAFAALAPLNGHGPADADALTTATAMAGRAALMRALGIFALTLAIVSTGAFTSLGGVRQGLFAPIAAWLAALVPGEDSPPLWIGPLTLIAYEPFVILLGLVGAWRAMRRGDAAARLLVLWLALALLVGLIAPSRGAALLAGAVVPATLLAAPVLLRLATRAWARSAVDYVVALLVLAWGASLVLLGLGHVTQPDPVGVKYIAPLLVGVAGTAGSADLAMRLIVALPIALFAGAVVYLAQRRGGTMRPSVVLAGATLLFIFTVHSAWNLAYQSAENVGELPRSSQSSVDVRALASDVDEVMQVLTINRKEKSLVIADSLRYPLSWYLRDGARFEAHPFGAPAMLVLPAEVKPPPGRFTGQRYRVTVEGVPGFANPAAFWRWLIYRERPAAVRTQDAMLFVRAQ